jgi:DNA-binding Lrp family transcriptional regulator
MQNVNLAAELGELPGERGQEEIALLLDAAPSEPAARTTADAEIGRLVARLSVAYVLRVFQLARGAFGDGRAGLLALAIHTANTAHLDPRTEAGRRVAGRDGILPDELRRPISISRLADSVGLPFESARRVVQGLIDAGHCARVEGGVIIPASALCRPELARAVIANLGYTRRFVRDLQTVGLADASATAWTQQGDAADECALARNVARITFQYVLRALRLLTQSYGDIRLAIVAQTIVTANTAHLDTRLHKGLRYAGIDDPPPNEERYPISIVRLAESLRAPYETTRAQVQRLVDAGVCMRVDGGLIVPQAVFEEPAAVSAALENMAYLRKFVRDLQRFAATLSPGDMEADARDQNIRSYISLLEGEHDPARRDALRRLLIAEEDRHGSHVERLERVDRLIADCEERLSRAELQLRRRAETGRGAERLVCEGERLRANMQDVLATTRAYRRSLVESLERRGI